MTGCVMSEKRSTANWTKETYRMKDYSNDRTLPTNMKEQTPNGNQQQRTIEDETDDPERCKFADHKRHSFFFKQYISRTDERSFLNYFRFVHG